MEEVRGKIALGLATVWASPLPLSLLFLRALYQSPRYPTASKVSCQRQRDKGPGSMRHRRGWGTVLFVSASSRDIIGHPDEVEMDAGPTSL